MPKLHLIPGEIPGDTAQIVTTPEDVATLLEVLQRAEREAGYAAPRVCHRDGSHYSLVVDVPRDDHDRWQDISAIYVPNQLQQRVRTRDGAARGVLLGAAGVDEVLAQEPQNLKLGAWA